VVLRSGPPDWDKEATAVKLEFLRPLYEGVGDYVSVYLDTDRAHEKAVEDIAVRWHDAREELTAAGADTATLDAAGAEIDVGEDRGRAVFARDGAVTLTGALDAPPRREIARLAPLPHLMPLLAQLRPLIPHVRVSVTHEGGEVVTVGGTGAEWRDSVAGKTWPIHRAKIGGWSQARFQRHVEDTWAENAKALAAEVAAAADRVKAQHVIVAGDVQSRSLLISHLPTLLAESATVVPEEVTADSPAMTKAADQALAGWAGRQARERFDDWQGRRAHGLGVEGLAQVMTAFRNGQVSDLFVADDPTSDATVWIGPGGSDLAESRDELVDRGVADPVPDRADAALVRAVALTDAELHFLPADLVKTGDAAAFGHIAFPRDGVAATLRFSLAAG
jgi:Bacterial archaeo-eukaryotic release factor family 2